jgi:hypothetical protein
MLAEARRCSDAAVRPIDPGAVSEDLEWPLRYKRFQVCDRALLQRRGIAGRHEADGLTRRGRRAWHANRKGDHQQPRVPSVRQDPQPRGG